MKIVINNFILISFFQLIGFVSSLCTRDNQYWYKSLTQSVLTPPNIVFPIIWPILYTGLAIVGAFLWRQLPEPKARNLLIFYILQLLFNWSWTPIFFGLHLIGTALLVIIIMVIITTYLILKTWKTYPYISYFMVIYLSWLLFATYLNFVIWQYN
jgi:benzodiazapine receptor